MSEGPFAPTGGAAGAHGTVKTTVRLSICRGVAPRLSVGIPRADLEAIAGDGPRRATLSLDAAGHLRIVLDPQGLAFFAGETSAFYWVQTKTTRLPWPCTAEKRGAIRLEAVAQTAPGPSGGVIRTTEPLPDAFFASGRPPAPDRSVDQLRALVAEFNRQVEARKTRGETIEVFVEGGRARLRLVHEEVL